MMLAAADLGIGSAHSAVGEQDLARQLLGLPAGTTCAYLISLGYPAAGRLPPSGTRPGGRSTRSCTGAAGAARLPGSRAARG